MPEKFDSLIDMTANVVSAYVSNNSVPSADLSGLIVATHAAFSKLRAQPIVEIKEKITPAVPVKKSITPDFIVCLEDGKRFKSLKRHLRIVYNMSPQEYRIKWDLPSDYPMVAPAYAEARSNLAKAMGLGGKSRQATARKKKIMSKD